NKSKTLYCMFFKYVSVLLSSFLFFPYLTYAQGLDRRIDAWFSPIAAWWEQVVFAEIPFTDQVSIPLVLILLISGGIFFTLYFKFVNVRKLGVALKAVRGDYEEFEITTPEEAAG